ncbi:MAG: hypothetical protein H7Z38_04595 [Rubrivivax sp.]|nr:hypothetical protein [Pyrinomonadaceae bacterium]
MVGKLKLTGEEEKLVRGSKQAILSTGVSEVYFNEHFRLVQVVNKSGSRQIVWKYSLGEYETTLTEHRWLLYCGRHAYRQPFDHGHARRDL